jgi:hypothetical protein
MDQEAIPAFSRWRRSRRDNHSTPSCVPQSETETAPNLFDNWFDPIEAELRDRVREFIQVMIEGERRWRGTFRTARRRN